MVEAISRHHIAEGFSRKLLAEKLGLKAGLRIIIVNPPRGYLNEIKSSSTGLIFARKLRDPLDFIQFFASEREELERTFPALENELAQSGMLWISWPKGSSNVKTDLNGGVIRDIGLKNGLVDVKVVAVDEVWSALKFIYRSKNRKKTI